MWCIANKCTMSTNACISRRYKAKIGAYRKVDEESFKKCLRCIVGYWVQKNPKRFINRDIEKLKEKHLKEVLERGYIFKTVIQVTNEDVNDECISKSINKWNPERKDNGVSINNISIKKQRSYG